MTTQQSLFQEAAGHQPQTNTTPEVSVYCDGSAKNGGQNSAAAAILITGAEVRAVGKFLGEATNQVAEIAAAILALSAIEVPSAITLYSDSQYVIRTMNGEFKRKANHEHWNRLDAAAARHQVTWQWIRGHHSHKQQEAADNLAQAIADANSVPLVALAHAERLAR